MSQPSFADPLLTPLFPTAVGAHPPPPGLRGPEHFGSWRDEYGALRHASGWARLDRPTLLLGGEDRHRFLNGQMTCDVRQLASGTGTGTGTGTYGFFTTPKGRVEADGVVLALEDALSIVLPQGSLDPIAARLRKYIIVDRVTVAADPQVGFAWVGPQALDWLKPNQALGDAPWSHTAGHCLGHGGRIVRQADLGGEAFSFWLPAQEEQALLRSLAAEAHPEGPRPVGWRALEALRLEEGRPRFGLDFGEENLPQETGLDAAVQYDKGCYLGQEVVARLHFRGQVSRQLRRLVFDGEEAPPPGTELLWEGREAGRVTSSSPSPTPGGAIGLGMIQRRAFEPGTRLQVAGGGSAEVRGATDGRSDAKR